jgi:hypothetical protein
MNERGGAMTQRSDAWRARLAQAGIALAAGGPPAIPGVAAPDAAAPDAAAPDAAASAPPAPPWPLRLIAGIGGFMGALMVLLFIGAGLGSLRLFDSAEAATVIGAGLCIAAWAAYRVARGAAAEQFALALSLAGQIAFAIGTVQLFRSGSAMVWWPLVALEVLLWLLVANAQHRTLVGAAWVLFAALSCRSPLALALLSGGVALLATLMAIGEGRLAERGFGGAMAPGVFGLLVGLILTQLPWFALLMQLRGPSLGWLDWYAELPALALAAWAAAGRAPAATRVAVLLLAVALGGLGAWLPGWVAALLLALLGLASGRPAWAVVAAAALMFAVSRYYYDLAVTLLQKAAWMAAAGLACLMLAAVIRKVGAALAAREAVGEGAQ